MSKKAKITVISIVAVLAIFYGNLMGQAIALDRDIREDINGYLDLAYSAPTAEFMASMIDKALIGLDKWDMDEGSWAIYYRTPETRMEYAREQLASLRDRAIEVENKERGSVGYAMSLEEMKMHFKRIDVSPYAYHTIRNAILLYPSSILLLTVGVLIMFLMGLAIYIAVKC